MNSDKINQAKTIIDNSFNQFKEVLKFCNSNKILMDVNVQKIMSLNDVNQQFIDQLLFYLKSLINDLL